jgi:hypothetical protein
VKQVLALGVVAFAFAVGGATWFIAFVAPPPLPVAPDSAAVAIAVAPPPSPRPGRDTGAIAPQDTAPRADSSARQTRPAPIALPTDDPERAKAVAKIMAAMKPKEAVSILERMSDDEVEGILRRLTAKQVAALLAVMPGDRAAQLSRRLLKPESPGPKGTTP